MARSEHVTAEEMLELAERRAGAELVHRAAAHLETGCAVCAGQLRFWTRTLDGLKPDALAEPPEAVVRRAVALFPVTPRAESWIVVAARLLFDSRTAPALAGARDAAGTAFQLLFEAGESEIDLLCEPSGLSWRITGHVVGQGGEAGTVRLEGPVERETALDAAGEFRLDELPAGTYRLALRSGGRELAVPEIRLGV